MSYNMSMKNKKLFWVIERDYLAKIDEELEKVREACDKVTNLREALDTGLASIHLKIGDNGYDSVGYLREDGTYYLSEPYATWEKEGRDGVDVTYCHFMNFETDDDGSVIGVFEMERPYDAE